MDYGVLDSTAGYGTKDGGMFASWVFIYKLLNRDDLPCNLLTRSF